MADYQKELLKLYFEEYNLAYHNISSFNYFINHTHSRLPVYRKTIDNITHFMTIRDILNKDRNKKLKELNLNEVLRVPLNQPIDKLLKTFQNARKHLAIVMDEYG